MLRIPMTAEDQAIFDTRTAIQVERRYREADRNDACYFYAWTMSATLKIHTPKQRNGHTLAVAQEI